MYKKVIIALSLGSSPRMWETLCMGSFESGYFRFIPTHVGNTNAEMGCFEVGAVHPHACGKHGLILTLRNKDGGSSPRMWETLNNTTEMSIRLRFIPTHVGNTFAKVEALAFLPVHPHACGKHSTSLS